MHWANIKDFPEFYHLDTLLFTSRKPVEDAYPSLYSFQKNTLSESFQKKPKTKIFHHQSQSENVKLPLISSPTARNNLKSNVISETLRRKIQNNLVESKFKIKQNEINEANNLLRTKEFLKYLNTLSSEPLLPHHFPKKNSWKKISTSRKSSPSKIFSSINENPKNPKNLNNSKNPKNPKSLKHLKNSNYPKYPKTDREKNNKVKTNNFKDRIDNNLSPIKLNFSNYEMNQEINKILSNLSEMKKITFNSKKIYGLLKNFLSYKKSILRKILLNEDHEILNEGISALFIQKIDQNLIKEMKELNMKIESYITLNELEKIKLMEQEVIVNFQKMKTVEDRLKSHKNREIILKDYQPIEKYNYENIPTTKLVEDLNSFEKNHGECEFIHNRSRLICQAIENSVKNVRSECDL